MEALNELALFAGAGGGILGGHLLGWRTVCAVELDEYARDVLVARQNDGCLEPFPIWDDVCTFDGKPWRGIVDVVSGGFPCQDISAAGKHAGIDGECSGLWREMARIIGEVRPRFALVENSPMLVVRGLDRVCGDLAKMGYDGRWGVFSAADVGARTERARVFLVASRDGFLFPPRPWAECQRGELENDSINREASETDIERAFVAMAQEHAGMDDRMAYPVDAVRCVGNGQVPAVVRLAWETLTGREG